jgi:hypothetical protein
LILSSNTSKMLRAARCRLVPSPPSPSRWLTGVTLPHVGATGPESVRDAASAPGEMTDLRRLALKVQALDERTLVMQKQLETLLQRVPAASQPSAGSVNQSNAPATPAAKDGAWRGVRLPAAALAPDVTRHDVNWGAEGAPKRSAAADARRVRAGLQRSQVRVGAGRGGRAARQALVQRQCHAKQERLR